MSYINSLSQTQYLMSQIQSQQTQLNTLSDQISSGQISTNFSGYSPAAGRLSIALRAQLERNTTYANTIGTLTQTTAVIANSLTDVQDTLSSLKATATELATATTQDSGQALQITGQTQLQSIISALNVTVDGQSPFSGAAVNTSGQTSYPIASESTIATNVANALATAHTTYGATLTDAQVNAAISSAFGTSTGTGSTALSNWYLPGYTGVPSQPVQIADDRTVQASISALPVAAGGSSDAISQTLQVASAIAYVTPADFGGSLQLYQDYIASTVKPALTAVQSLSDVAAANGTVEAALQNQLTVNQAQTTIVTNAVSSTEDVDQAQAISKLDNLQTQLQASYEVTAQLKGLSLAAYLG
jgi:flagellar hook-associated protein 3 FlgL